MGKLKKALEWWIAPKFVGREQITSGIGVDGLEYPDPIPLAPAVLQPVETQGDMVMRMIQSARLREAAELEGFDTEEEADDFEIEDDPLDPLTQWEEPYLPPKKPAVAKDAVPPSSATPPVADAPKPPEPPVKRSESDAVPSKE